MGGEKKGGVVRGWRKEEGSGGESEEKRGGEKKGEEDSGEKW